MEKVIFDVIGMSWGRCEQSVVNALKDLGAEEATAKSHTNKVTVTFDPNVVSFKEIMSEIADIGFQPIEPKTVDGWGPDGC